jgi:cholestenol delta-isomerase
MQIFYFAFWRAVWKEYAKADSRYLIIDPTIFSIEAITSVLVGPLCLLAVYAIMRRKPYRWIVITIVSLMQIYGDMLYFISEYLENFRHIDPSNWDLHFGLYFCGLNTIWLILPGLLLFQVGHIVCL